MPGEEPVPEVQWDLRREGRSWSSEEWNARRELTPEKFELSRGKLFWCEEHRLAVVALMIENLGVDQVVRLGDPQVWRDAIAALDEPQV
jgi:hypothetical protein